MERGDAGLGRDAYGLPRRRRLGERRAFRSGGGGAGTGAQGTDGANGVNGLGDDEDDEYYGQLLRRPGDLPPYQSRLREPGRPRPPQPGRYPPSGGHPGSGYAPNGDPGSGYPGGGYPPGGDPAMGYAGGGYPPGGDPGHRNGYPPNGYPPNGDPASGYAPNGSPASGYPPHGDLGGGYSGNGNPAGGYAPGGDSGSSYPNGDPGSGYPQGGNPGSGYGPTGNAADGYGPSGNAADGYAPRGGAPGGGTGYGNAGYGNAGYGNAGYGSAGYGSAGNGGPTHRHQYRLPNGRRVPPGADRLYRPPAPGAAGGPGPGGGSRSRPGPGQDPLGGTWSRAARPSAAPGSPPGPGGARAYGGSRPDGWEHLREAPPSRGVPISAEPTASLGPASSGTPGGPAVIRQRESAVPDERPVGASRPVASIAPDGLESFARDLRVLRAKAELDYPEMAEASHYTMKTLASAAGGLRLPTLPVAVAYVRACGGNVAEWEERWQKMATKITSDAAKRRRGDGDEQQAPPEPADPPAVAEPPMVTTAKEPDPEPGEVYVITSAKPRQPGW